MKQIITIFIILISYNFTFSQEKININLKEFKKAEEGFKEAKDNLKNGDNLFKKNTENAYTKAINHYLEAYKYNPKNPELNYKIGISYLETIHKKEALKYLQIASKKKNISFLINWQLGRAYQYNLMFDEAILYYSKFKRQISKNGGPTVKVKRRIDECKAGKILVSNPTNATVLNINNINSKFPDYCPLITADESMMIFTGRIKNGTGNKIAKDGLPFEDIYISYNKNRQWTTPENIGEPLNTEYHDATIGLSPDGQQLFLYHNQDIYMSKLEGNKWTLPVRFPETINTDEVENSACISFDGKALYFTRGKNIDPEKSNADIYVSYKKNGKWTAAKRLPSIINTKYDEDGVFMHPDGKTLFFSSKGHNTMGGFDIFKSTLNEDGKWTKPINLGFPINTTNDDLYFVMSADGKTGYYSSIKKEGKGFMDIYKIEYSDPLKVKKDTIVKEEFMLTIVKGVITDGVTGKKIKAKIEIFNIENNENILNSESNSSTGKYLISLPSGKNYGMQVTKTDYIFHSENFNIPEVEGYQEIIKNIKLYPIKKDVKVVLNNIFFDLNKSNLRKESYAELDRLKELLETNPNIVIEISGHTDNQGSHEYNINLSAARAKAVVNYLISKGIDKKRLSSRGASWDEPVASNKTKEGRQLNRRVEFKIITK